jgi:uncharacterized protein
VPVQPTYPGVYIEEVPSAVHTIVGVSTSITAFIGYTALGPVNQAVHIYNYGDYERAFGGLDGDSPVSYAVQQFFQNGGIEAYVVRVAANAAEARVELRDKVGAGQQTVLTARAANAGIWGNNVLLTVDYAAANPLDQFNLTVVMYRQQAGALVVAATETYRNLSMNAKAPNHAVDTVNASSAIVRLARPAGLTSADRGQAVSAVLNEAAIPYAQIGPAGQYRAVAVSVDGKPTVEIPLPAPTGASDQARLTSIGNAIRAGAPGLDTGFASLTGASGTTRQLQFRTANTGEDRSVRFMSAAQNDAAAILGLGLLNGGRETDGSASLRPAESGTVGTDQSGLNLSGLTTDQTVDLTIDRAVRADSSITGLVVSRAADGPPATLEILRGRIEAALRAAAATNPDSADELAGARVLLVDNRFQVIPSGPGDSVFKVGPAAAGSFASTLGLTGTSRQNVGLYRLGVGPTLSAQANAVSGADGTPPSPGDIRGNEAARTGMYALQEVDLFNILCLPGQSDNTLLAEAMSYCERRRAFLIVDVPKNVDTLVEAQSWISSPNTPTSKNAAAYFPWVVLPDPLQDYRPQAFPPSGMLAGLYARTDGTRGVWKAPAGTDANLRGAQGLTYNLSDPENGALNPLGLNSIRSLRVYGIVAWGARTLFGADQRASEWKYIPVRRIALFIEESLYRGTQWVVFEPNDEPLWSQIRLNVGAFMHNLFRQGAFQGKSPREAYLVKCDSETTTQADIDLGIVNILVGFAPLKPAEFVILKISQLAGQVEA